MTKKIFVLLVGILSMLYFNLGNAGIVPFSLVDMCFSYYPENWGKYPYVQGKLYNPTTINFKGKFIGSQVVYQKLSYGSPDYIIYYRVCNSVGNCVENWDYIRPFSYSGEYSDCYNSCTKYNWPSQCSYGYKLPIPYTCSNICNYDTSLLMLDSLGKVPDPNGQYTITITKVKKYQNGNWVEVPYQDFNIYYVVFYDPTSSPFPQPSPPPLNWLMQIFQAIVEFFKNLFGVK